MRRKGRQRAKANCISSTPTTRKIVERHPDYDSDKDEAVKNSTGKRFRYGEFDEYNLTTPDCVSIFRVTIEKEPLN